MTWLQISELLGIGLCAGCLGGLLGVGGSIFIIPALAITFGPNQHLYQAAAMIMNVLVAFAGAVRHYRARAIRWDVVRRMLPAGIAFILLGVTISNKIESRPLQVGFGLFLLYTLVVETISLVRRSPEVDTGDERVGPVRCGIVGSLMGLVAGLLGIGGGGVTVPLLRRVCHLSLKPAIATSAAVMCVTAIFGAIHKNATLPSHLGPDGAPLQISQSLLMAACMAPTGIIGGVIGAGWTHRFPIVVVKVAFIGMVFFAALKMLGIV